ncbi:VOC family protein [Pedobacter panaciterrae]
MKTSGTYLTFNGNCEEAFNFYKSIFGGDFGQVSRFGEMPQNLVFPLDETEKNNIMYISLPIGSSMLMGCDAGSDGMDALQQGNNFSVMVAAESKAEAQKVFDGFARYGQISRPLTDVFWGAFLEWLSTSSGLTG